MTPTDTNLAMIGWSRRELARRLGVPSRTVHNWWKPGAAPPADVVEWLERVADAVEQLEPPR